jgi:hypothetical protein
MRESVLVLAAAVGLIAAGCGYVGDPQPPTLNIPQPVAGLRASQTGDTLVIEFQQPANTTEGLPIRERQSPRVTVDGEVIPVEGDNETIRLQVPASPYAGKTVEVAVQAAAGSRLSEARAVKLRIEPPLAAPAGLAARSDPRGIHLTWQAEPGRIGMTYDVFRRGSADKEASGIGTAQATEYVDTAAVVGEAYEYSIRARLGDSESALSPPVKVSLVDTFPPAAPTGATAITGVSSIELAWERNTEADLRGYRVYRATKGGEPEVIADLVEAPAYSDRQITTGNTYSYAFTALDHAGNESPRSKPVEAAAP